MKNKKRIWLIAALTLALILECWWLFRDLPQAEPSFPCPGVITADPSCNMRRDPNTQREVLRELRKDVKVEVLAQVEGEAVGDNNVWYEIRYGSIDGYVSSSFVRLETEVLPPIDLPLPGEAEFQAELVSKGFPQDYVAKLMEIHRLHPYWQFRPLFTDYSFETAVAGEDRPGINMVTAGAPPEYKSMAESDFNYAANRWIEYEPGWVGASTALIAFQMDPRNFLDEIQIFQFENQAFNPQLDYRHGLAAILQGSFMDQSPIKYLDTEGKEAQLEGSYVDLIQQAGQTSGVSPYHLASRIIQEVSRGGSPSVSGSYLDMGGYYNFFNIGATGGADPAYMGLITARDGISGYSAEKNAGFLFPWTDPYRSIAGGAIFIGSDYINLDQNTLYLQKFNLASRYTRPFTHQYMGNVLAPEYEAIDVYKAYQQMGVLDEVKEFVIPVFASMPAQTASPTGGGNPNNWLAAIAVNGQPLPDFDSQKYEYKLDISAANAGLAIQAWTWNADSTVSGTGVYFLKPGRNEVILQVQAPNGSRRNYRLSIYQKEETAGLDPSGLPKLKNEKYKISALGYLFGADPLAGSNTRETILSSFNLPPEYQVDLVDLQGNSLNGAAGTGAAVRMMTEGRAVNEFPLVILGDTNGDASIDVLDLNEVYSRVLKKNTALNTALDLAMDVDQDGTVDVLDMNLIYAQLSGGAGIPQSLRK